MTVREFDHEWNNGLNYIEAMTSGSTGSPKLVRLYKRDMVKSACATLDFFKIKRGATFVCPMDFKYIGAKMMFVRAFVNEGKLIEKAPSNKIDLDIDADLLAVVPSQIDHILQDKNISSKIKNLIIGGAPLSPERQRIIKQAGLNAYMTYGMTETSSHVALAEVCSDIYRALPNIEFELDDRGCMVINMKDRIANRIITNDMVELISTTSFKWLGRYDNIINTGGIKIQPEVLEKEILKILKDNNIIVQKIAIIGENSVKWGTQIALIIEKGEYEIEENTEMLLSLIKNGLYDSRLTPKVIYFRPVSITENGKIIRR